MKNILLAACACMSCLQAQDTESADNQTCQPATYMCTFGLNEWVAKQMAPALKELVHLLRSQQELVNNIESHDAHTQFQNLLASTTVFEKISTLKDTMNTPGVWPEAYTQFMRDPENKQAHEKLMEHVTKFWNLYRSQDLHSIRVYDSLKETFEQELQPLIRAYTVIGYGQVVYQAELPLLWPWCTDPLIDPTLYCTGYAADNAPAWFDLNNLTVSGPIRKGKKLSK